MLDEFVPGEAKFPVILQLVRMEIHHGIYKFSLQAEASLAGRKF